MPAFTPMNALACDHRFAGSISQLYEETLVPRSSSSPTRPTWHAVAYCQGTPLRNEIEARGASRLAEATEAAAMALANRFGPGQIEGQIRAHVVTIER